MASRSFPPLARRRLTHLLRNGATFGPAETATVQLARSLAQLGIIRLEERRYLLCADPADDDYLDVPDPTCEGRIVLGAVPLVCPVCGRPLEYPEVDKRVQEEWIVDLHLPGIANYFFDMLRATGQVVRLVPIDRCTAHAALADGSDLVAQVTDEFVGRRTVSSAAQHLPHLEVVPGLAASAVDGDHAHVALVDLLSEDSRWLAELLQRVVSQAPAVGALSATAALRPMRLDIRIDACRDEGYPIELCLDNTRYFRGVTPGPPTRQVCHSDDRALFAWLSSASEVAAGWQAACEASDLVQIRLRLEAPELVGLPWEAMRAPIDGAWVEVAAAAATPFARYLARPGRPRRAIAGHPLRFLAAVAAPVDLAQQGMAPIEPSDEASHLAAALQPGLASLQLLPAPCTLAALARSLRDGYHGLHMVAHGAVGDDDLYIMLEDEQGRLAPVTGRELASAVARAVAGAATGLRFVFLDICHSGAGSGLVDSLALALAVAGVPAVVAMQGAVPTRTSRRFARVFYPELLAHGAADRAANQARAALLADRMPGNSVPVLYLRQPDGRLFLSAGAAPSSRETEAFALASEVDI